MGERYPTPLQKGSTCRSLRRLKSSSLVEDDSIDSPQTSHKLRPAEITALFRWTVSADWSWKRQSTVSFAQNMGTAFDVLDPLRDQIFHEGPFYIPSNLNFLANQAEVLAVMLNFSNGLCMEVVWFVLVIAGTLGGLDAVLRALD